MNNIPFTPNQQIIWCSSFGYEIGYFLKEDPNQYYKYVVDLVTGVVIGEGSFSRSEIKPYSEELINELANDYGYIKKF